MQRAGHLDRLESAGPGQVAESSHPQIRRNGKTFGDRSTAEGAHPGDTWGPGQGKYNSTKQSGGEHGVTGGQPEQGSNQCGAPSGDLGTHCSASVSSPVKESIIIGKTVMGGNTCKILIIGRGYIHCSK